MVCPLIEQIIGLLKLTNIDEATKKELLVLFIKKTKEVSAKEHKFEWALQKVDEVLALAEKSEELKS